MGCPRLTYYPTTELKIISSKKVLTFCKSENNNRSAYLFGFNGMEKDNEVKGVGNSLDFGARIYDSRLGRFLSLDPKMSEFPWQSPYVFADNSPIIKIDTKGKNGEIVITKKSAEVGAVIQKVDVNLIMYSDASASTMVNNLTFPTYASSQFNATYGRKTFNVSNGNNTVPVAFHLDLQMDLTRPQIMNKYKTNRSSNYLEINSKKATSAGGYYMNFNIKQLQFTTYLYSFSHELSHLLGSQGDTYSNDYMSSYNNTAQVQDEEVNEMIQPAIDLANKYEGNEVIVHLFSNTMEDGRAPDPNKKEYGAYNTYRVYDKKNNKYLESKTVPLINN